jgi:hypothetical protein
MQKKKGVAVDKELLSTIEKAVQDGNNKLKLEIHDMFAQYGDRVSHQMQCNTDENKIDHKQFYERLEKLERDFPLINQRLETIEKQHGKNHGA